MKLNSVNLVKINVMKKIVKKSIASVLILAGFLACQPEPLPNISSPTTPTNPAVTPTMSFTFQEGSDTIQTADSAYWTYSQNGGSAYLYAFKGGNRQIQLYLGAYDNNQVTTGEKGLDEQAMGFLYKKGIDSYSIAGYHAYNILVPSSNYVSGDFNFQIHPNPNTATNPINRLKATFSNIPYRP
jgi:hypothetical protein